MTRVFEVQQIVTWDLLSATEIISSTKINFVLFASYVEI